MPSTMFDHGVPPVRPTRCPFLPVRLHVLRLGRESHVPGSSSLTTGFPSLLSALPASCDCNDWRFPIKVDLCRAPAPRRLSEPVRSPRGRSWVVGERTRSSSPPASAWPSPSEVRCSSRANLAFLDIFARPVFATTGLAWTAKGVQLPGSCLCVWHAPVTRRGGGDDLS